MRSPSNWRYPFPGKYYDDSWFREIAACKQITDDAVRTAASGPAGLAVSKPDRAREHSDPARAKVSGEALTQLIMRARQRAGCADVARVQVEKGAIMLSSAETRAFRCPDEPAAPLLRDIVARAELAEARRSFDPSAIERAKAAVEHAIAVQYEAKSEISINVKSSARALEKAVE